MRHNEKRKDWLSSKADMEDNYFVSAGGLISTISETEKNKAEESLARPAFIRLLDLTRREHRLSWEQFAGKLEVDVTELMRIENDESFVPTPRTVYRIAEYLRISPEKLAILSGLAIAKNTQFKEATIKFAARSQPIEELTSEEHTALEEFVVFLSDK